MSSDEEPEEPRSWSRKKAKTVVEIEEVKEEVEIEIEEIAGEESDKTDEDTENEKVR